MIFGKVSDCDELMRFSMRAMTLAHSRMLPMAEILVTDDGLMKGDDVVGADADDQEENAISHKGIIKWESETQKLEFLRVLTHRYFLFVDLLETARANSAFSSVGGEPDFGGQFVVLCLLPVWIEEFLSFVSGLRLGRDSWDGGRSACDNVH